MDEIPLGKVCNEKTRRLMIKSENHQHVKFEEKNKSKKQKTKAKQGQQGHEHEGSHSNHPPLLLQVSRFTGHSLLYEQ